MKDQITVDNPINILLINMLQTNENPSLFVHTPPVNCHSPVDIFIHSFIHSFSYLSSQGS
jgi:hypothetical protein